MVSSLKGVFKEVNSSGYPITAALSGHIVADVYRGPSDAPEPGC